MENSSDLSFALWLQGASVGVPVLSCDFIAQLTGQNPLPMALIGTPLNFDSTSRVSISIRVRKVQILTFPPFRQ